MSHINLITRNSTIDEWRIQTNLTANAMNRLESGDFEKSNGDLILSGNAKLIITSSPNPCVIVANNVSFSSNLTVGGTLFANSAVFSGNVSVGSLTLSGNLVANNITSNNLLTAAVTKSTTYQETKSVISASDINLSSANYFTKTITGTTTFTVSNVPAAGVVASFILDLTNGGSYSLNWWSGIQWPNGLQPVLSISGRDVLGFFTHDGGVTWSGFILGKNLS